MPSSEALTDDYLAQLLAKDAKDKTIKYSSFEVSMGMTSATVTKESMRGGDGTLMAIPRKGERLMGIVTTGA
ncbi:MAG: hypothetical protein Q9210_001295 [Variospora velana]